MSISRDSTNEQIASSIKVMNQQQESLDKRQKDLVMIEHAELKRSLGSFWKRKFVIGALGRECLRLRQEVKELQARLPDKS